MTTQDLLAKALELQDRIEDLKSELASILQQWASRECPYYVGQITDVRGYSFKGRKCRIDKVYSSTDWKSDNQWAVKGSVLRKDGSPGSQQVSWKADQDVSEK